jgi:adenine-specific DNA-methyltransferase
MLFPVASHGLRMVKGSSLVDDNDSWRHSKWLSMMHRRLLIALRLLKPSGIMVITIDDCEVHRLKCLISDNFKGLEILGTVVIRNAPQTRSTTRGFAVAHEYAVFVGRTEAAAIGRLERSADQMARYNQTDEQGVFEWVNFRKPGGLFTYRTARPKQFYPIYVTESSIRIPQLEWIPARKEWRVLEKVGKGEETVWPIDSSGNERVWSWGHATARESLKEMAVRRDQQGKLGVYRKLRPNREGSLPVSWWENSITRQLPTVLIFSRESLRRARSFPFQSQSMPCEMRSGSPVLIVKMQ